MRLSVFLWPIIIYVFIARIVQAQYMEQMNVRLDQDIVHLSISLCPKVELSEIYGGLARRSLNLGNSQQSQMYLAAGLREHRLEIMKVFELGEFPAENASEQQFFSILKDRSLVVVIGDMRGDQKVNWGSAQKSNKQEFNFQIGNAESIRVLKNLLGNKANNVDLDLYVYVPRSDSKFGDPIRRSASTEGIYSREQSVGEYFKLLPQSLSATQKSGQLLLRIK